MKFYVCDESAVIIELARMGLRELEANQPPPIPDPAAEIKKRYAKRQREYWKRYAIDFEEIARVAYSVNYGEEFLK